MDIELRKKASSLLEGTVYSYCVGYIEIVTNYILMAAFTPGFEYSAHEHSFYEFHYIYDGKGTVGIGNNTFSLEKGDFYVTSPNSVHWQIADMDDPMVEYCIRYKTNKTEEHLQSNHIESEIECVLRMLDERTDKVVKDLHQLDEKFHHIFQEILLKRIGYHQVIINESIQILYAAVRNFSFEGSNFETNRKTLNVNRCENVSAYIYDNIHRRLTYEAVAKQMNMSERHLSRIIQQEKGQTLYELILELRLKKVIHYLENTFLRLKDIAELTGFCSEYHLSKTVKKELGKNTSEFRQGFQKNHA